MWCPLSLLKSQYLSLFLDSVRLAMGGGAVHLTESFAKISFGVLVRGVNSSACLRSALKRPLTLFFVQIFLTCFLEFSTRNSPVSFFTGFLREWHCGGKL